MEVMKEDLRLLIERLDDWSLHLLDLVCDADKKAIDGSVLDGVSMLTLRMLALNRITQKKGDEDTVEKFMRRVMAELKAGNFTQRN